MIARTQSTRAARRIRRVRRWSAVVLCTYAFGFASCDEDLVKRFREVAGPGLITGLGSALTDPTEAEAGFRAAGNAILEGLGAIVQPRSASVLDLSSNN